MNNFSSRAVTALFVAAGISGVAALPSHASTAAVPACTNADLAASYAGGSAGMSHVYGRIVLTNTSDHACRTGGYGGLSYVGGRNGTQIGAAADRTPGTVRVFVLDPAQRLKSKVAETSFAPYPKSRCRPRHVDGFRVYVPDSTQSQFVAHPTTGCANTAVHLLAHQPLQRP